MQAGSYGLNIPDPGDKGSDVGGTGKTIWGLIRDLFSWCIAHDHDGVNSSSITIGALTKTSQAISKNDWSGPTNDLYYQTVNMPTGLQYGEAFPRFWVNENSHADDGHEVILETEKVSATSFKIYSFDNTFDITAKYF